MGSEVGFVRRSFPPERELVVDAGYLAAGRHIIYGLLDVDVTAARARRREIMARDGVDLSFTAFLVASLGRAVAAQPEVQAYRDWRGRLVVFEDVDVVTMVEPQPGAVAIPHIVRAAQQRSVAGITAEIRAVQSAKPSAEQSRQARLIALAPRLPRPLRLLFFHAVKRNPERFKELQGTVILTAVGMFGMGGGWGVGFLPTHTLGVTVGGMVKKPGVHEGAIAIRDYLQMTVAFDHDIVDGAPAARFSRQLVMSIESGGVLAG